MPPPENLTVSEAGLVQWQPPYSSLETEAVRYFLYNIRYSVEVTDGTEVESKVASSLTNDTIFVFLPPLECVEYVVSVRALNENSEGDPAEVTVPPTRDFEAPEPICPNDAMTILEGDIIILFLPAYDSVTCSSPTTYFVEYNNKVYNSSAETLLQFTQITIDIDSSEGCFISVITSNRAGNSNATQIPIKSGGMFVYRQTIISTCSHQTI